MEVIKEGYLYKEGGAPIKNWKKRLFQLCTDNVLYYGENANKVQENWIPLENVLGIESRPIPQAKPKEFSQFGFAIKISNRTYHIVAENASVRDEWVSVLNQRLKSIEPKSEEKNQEKEVEDEEEEEEEEEDLEDEEEEEEEDDDEEEEEEQVNDSKPKQHQSLKSVVTIEDHFDADKEVTKQQELKKEEEDGEGTEEEEDDEEESESEDEEEEATPKKDSQPQQISSTPAVQTQTHPSTPQHQTSSSVQNQSSQQSQQDEEPEEDGIQEEEEEENEEEQKEQIIQDDKVKKDQFEELISFTSLELLEVDLKSKIYFEKEEVAALLPKMDAFKVSMDARPVGLKLKTKKDNAHIESNRDIRDKLSKLGEKILWSGEVMKFEFQVNKKMKRALIVTEKSLCIVDNKLNEIKKRIPLREVEYVIRNLPGDAEEEFGIVVPQQKQDHMFTGALKQEFIDYLCDAYQANNMGKELNNFVVTDVKYYIRKKLNEKKPLPEPISDADMIQSSENDYKQLTMKHALYLKLRKNGCKIIYFSDVVLQPQISKKKKKEEEHVFVITDEAVYHIDEDGDTIRRRIDLTLVKEVCIDSTDIKTLLIKVPKEYDMAIITEKRSIITEAFKKANIRITSAENVIEIGSLKKPSKMKESKQKVNPEIILRSLTEALEKRNVYEIEKAIDAAKRADLDEEDSFINCVIELKKIKEMEQIDKEWNENLGQDLFTMNALLQRAEKLKPYCDEFLTKNQGLFNFKVNGLLFEKRTGEALLEGKGDLKRIGRIFDVCRKAGIPEVVLKYQKKYDFFLQRDNMLTNIQLFINDHDGNGLRLILQNVEALNIPENHPVIMEAKKYIPIFREEANARRRLFKAVDDAMSIGNPEIIEKAIEELQEKYPYLKQCGDIERAYDEINLIKDRNSIKEEIEKMITSRNIKALVGLIEKAEEDTYLEETVIRAKSCLDEIKKDNENERIAQVYNLKDAIGPLMTTLENIEDEAGEDEEKKIFQLMKEARVHPELIDLAGAIKHLLNIREQRRLIKEELQEAMDEQNIPRLKQLIPKAEEHPNLYEIVLKAKELTEALEQEREAQQSLTSALKARNSELVSKALISAKNWVSLQDEVESAEQELEIIKEEEELVKQLTEAVTVLRDMDMIITILDHCKKYKHLTEHSKVIHAKEELTKLKKQRELSQELDLLIEKESRDEIYDFMTNNRQFMTVDTFVKAQATWTKLFQSSPYIIQLKEEFEKAIFTKNKFGIKRAVLQVKILKGIDERIENYIVKAREILGDDVVDQLFSEQSEPLAGIQEEAALAATNKVMVETKPEYKILLEAIHRDTMKLLKSCSTAEIDDDTGRYLIELNNPFCQSVVRDVCFVLNFKTKKLYWIRERNVWEIFKNFRNPIVQKVVNAFEAHPICSSIPRDSNYSTVISLLFVEYMLEKDKFFDCIDELMNNAAYLNECYMENESIMNSSKWRDEIAGTFSLLKQFMFQFGFLKQENQLNISMSEEEGDPLDLIVAANPVAQLKGAIRALVNYFFMHGREKNAAELKKLGDDTEHGEVGILVRSKLYTSLHTLMSSGFKSFGIFRTSHLWDMIMEITNKKKTSAIDIGGIGLPNAVYTANKVVEEKKLLNATVQQVNDMKFKAFVCIALNDRQLSDFIRSIYREQEIVNKYYDTNVALLCKKVNHDKCISFLAKLDKLPFHIAYDL